MMDSMRYDAAVPDAQACAPGLAAAFEHEHGVQQGCFRADDAGTVAVQAQQPSQAPDGDRNANAMASAIAVLP